MRKEYSEAERQLYRDNQRREAEKRIADLAETWRDNPAQVAEYLQFSKQFHEYSPRNRMLMYSQNPGAMFVGSFKAFETMGYHIRRGEHGMRIMAYTPITYFRKSTQSAWRRVSDASDYEKQQINAGMLETREQAAYKVGTVFDIAQTDCPLEEYPKWLGMGYNDQQHAEVYAVLRDYSASIGMPVTEVSTGVRLRGAYYPATGRIAINQALGDTQKLSTLLHEISHGIMQHGVERGVSTARVEFEADALSIMLEDKYGIPVTDARCRHLAECFKAYRGELMMDGTAFEPEKAFARIHEQYDKHSVALEAYLKEQGIIPEEAPVKWIAEPEVPVKQEEPAPRASVAAEIKKSVRQPGLAQSNYYALRDLVPSVMRREVKTLQMKSEHFDPLRFEWLGKDMLAVAQIAVENGQTLRNPEMVLRIDDRAGIVQSISYRADRLNVFREVGVGIDTDLQLRRELNKMLEEWMKTIRFQGYYPIVQNLSSEQEQTQSMEYKYQTGLREICSEEGTPCAVDEYARAMQWMVSANCPDEESLTQNLGESKLHSDTYRMAKMIVNANDPTADPILQHAEAGGMTYVALERMGVPCEYPQIGDMDESKLKNLMAHIRRGVTYMQGQVMGALNVTQNISPPAAETPAINVSLDPPTNE